MEPQRFFFLNAAAYICDENLSYGSHVFPPATVNVHFALCFPHDVLMHAHVVHFQKVAFFTIYTAQFQSISQIPKTTKTHLLFLFSKMRLLPKVKPKTTLYSFLFQNILLQ